LNLLELERQLVDQPMLRLQFPVEEVRGPAGAELVLALDFEGDE
jgi:hypothetical protein